MNTNRLNILACQIDIPPMTSHEGRDAHLALSSDKVRERLIGQKVDIVVLPELSSIDYSREAFDRLDTLAEHLDGPSFQTWREVASEFGVFVCYGFPRTANDQFHISQAVVGPDGNLVGYFDKLHMAQFGASMEKEYFSKGSHLFCFEAKGFKLAPFICYDIRIPELARTLVLEQKVDVILHCGAYYRDPSFHTWHDFAVTRALENQIFFLSLNRAGENYGNSIFCWPWMDETLQPVPFEANNEEFKHLTLEREMLENARREYSFLKDRLEDYSLLHKSE
ncbi:MAG: carbon-nitrogen hydrolase family protein [Pseudomonadota bacterium]